MSHISFMKVEEKYIRFVNNVSTTMSDEQMIKINFVDLEKDPDAAAGGVGAARARGLRPAAARAQLALGGAPVGAGVSVTKHPATATATANAKRKRHCRHVRAWLALAAARSGRRSKAAAVSASVFLPALRIWYSGTGNRRVLLALRMKPESSNGYSYSYSSELGFGFD